MTIKAFTLCGSHSLQQPWVHRCMDSWKNILDVSQRDFFIIPDYELDEHGFNILQSKGFTPLNKHIHDQLIESELEKYPSLIDMRKKDFTWRKLLDLKILSGDADKVLFVDTDVYVSNPCKFVETESDIVYMCEDSPAYMGSWNIMLKEKMAPALNAGLILTNPSIIDFDFLDHLVRNYFIRCRKVWWTEQTAWACLAGRTEKRFMFDGLDVRVISGMSTRSYQDIINNRYNYLSKPIFSEKKSIESLLDNGAIYHFAGAGKWFFDDCVKYIEKYLSAQQKTIHFSKDRLLSIPDIFMGTGRLFYKQFYQKK